MTTGSGPRFIALVSTALNVVLLFTVGCQGPSLVQHREASDNSKNGFPITIVDDSKSTITIKAIPRRIVSLAPSNTELLFDIGAGPQVVADTESCDYPIEARKLPHVSGLNAQEVEKIEVHLPDLVVAVGSINQRLIGSLRAARIPTLVLEPHTTSEALADIRLLGSASGHSSESIQLATSMERSLGELRRTTARASTKPNVLIVFGTNPIYTAPPDSFIHDTVQLAGGNDIVQSPLPQNIISPAVVVERAPDGIICSESLRSAITQIPGWSSIPAVKNSRFFSTSGEAELTRPTPRFVKAAEQLAHFLHPELFARAPHLKMP